MAQKKRILIIDDEPDTLTYFSSLLQDSGYETETAADGQEGLAKVRERAPDLITLDISMPETSGVRCYRELRERAEWRSIPIVIVTGISEDFRNFISTRRQVPPPDGYLSKPIDESAFLKMIQNLLNR